MYIALTPKLARKFKVPLGSKKPTDSTDNVWFMTYISIKYPEKEDYLYLCHPDSTLTYIHKLNRNWKKHLEDEVKLVFEYFFEKLKEQGIDVGSYREELDKIEYIRIDDDYKELYRRFNLSKKNFSEDYLRSSRKDKQHYISAFYFDRLNDYLNTAERTRGDLTPFDRFKEMLDRNYSEVVPEEVSFEVNKKALTRPKPTRQTFGNSNSSKTDAEVLMFDRANLFVKEPVKKNERKLARLNQRYSKLLEGIDRKNIPATTRKKILDLTEKMSDLICHLHIPYTGEYKNLKLPEKLPKKMVLELLVTMDLDIYAAKRRILVPADMSFEDLDFLLTHLFRWAGFPYHISQFLFPDPETPESKDITKVVSYFEEDFPEEGTLKPTDMAYFFGYNPYYKIKPENIKEKKLYEYFPEHKTAQYRYDFGDNWYHAIELVGVYDAEDIDKPLPYLLDSTGVVPTEDSGGLPAFWDLINFKYDTTDREHYMRFLNEWCDEQKYYLKSPCSLAPIFEK